MFKNILVSFILLSISTGAFSQRLLFNSVKNVKMNHDTSVNVFNLYQSGLIFLNTPNNIPESRVKYLKFEKPWVSYYDYNSNKFLIRKNNSKRILPLRVDFFIGSSQIWDSEYSKFQILSQSDYHYNCIDISDGTEESGLLCKIIVTDNYLFIQYQTKTIIYSNNQL